MAWCFWLVSVMGSARAGAETPDPHAVQPERPTVATHAHTVAAGWIEIEDGIERDRFADASRGLIASMVTKVGITARAQLNLASAWQSVKRLPSKSSAKASHTKRRLDSFA